MSIIHCNQQQQQQLQAEKVKQQHALSPLWPSRINITQSKLKTNCTMYSINGVRYIHIYCAIMLNVRIICTNV